MGVEYTHWFIPRDPSWVVAPGTAERVAGCLTRHGLVVPDAVQQWNLRTLEQLHRPLSAIEPQDNVVVFFSCDLENAAEVTAALGPSYYADEDPDIESMRYLSGVVLVLGTDHRVHASGESLSVELVDPPPPRDVDDYGLHQLPLEDIWFSHSCFSYTVGRAQPPVVRVQPEITGFTGYWRAALCIDCHKDLPAFIDDGDRAGIANREFFRELEAAFGCRLIEVGVVH